jgi:hypothetical protein
VFRPKPESTRAIGRYALSTITPCPTPEPRTGAATGPCHHVSTGLPR